MNSIKRFSRLAWFTIPLGLLALFTVLVGISSVSADSAIPTPLTLRNHVTISGGSVHLGDIFDGFETPHSGISGETIVAYAPQPGRRAVFDANWLSRMAQRYRLDWRPTTRLDRVVVERASTVINAEDIVSALRNEIEARGNVHNFDLELSNRNLLVHIDSSLPPTIEVVNITTESRRGQFSAIISVPAGDPQAQRITVAGQMFSIVEVPVPVRALRPGSPIRESDLKWKRVRANSVRNDVVTELSEFVSRETKRPLSAGKMVQRSDLRAPVTVSKGMLVTMIFRTSSMVLTASGRSLETGSTGDFITVRNTQTDTIVDAKILGPNRVEVAALRQLASSEGEVQ
jgi:flagella basal body P-ring formation protein FlgA